MNNDAMKQQVQRASEEAKSLVGKGRVAGFTRIHELLQDYDPAQHVVVAAEQLLARTWGPVALEEVIRLLGDLAVARECADQVGQIRRINEFELPQSWNLYTVQRGELSVAEAARIASRTRRDLYLGRFRNEALSMVTGHGETLATREARAYLGG